MVSPNWGAVHRKHHTHCEKDGDPHSPKLFRIGQVLLQGAELYRREARVAATLQRYGAGPPDDWLERHIYSRYTWQGVGLMLVADMLMFDVLGLSVWGVQMLWSPVCAAGIINGLGHYTGYRNFDGPHAATNIMPVGILIGGEELHNNHHTFPTFGQLVRALVGARYRLVLHPPAPGVLPGTRAGTVDLQIPKLSLQRFHTLLLGGTAPRTLACIGFLLANPTTERFRRAADLGRN